MARWCIVLHITEFLGHVCVVCRCERRGYAARSVRREACCDSMYSYVLIIEVLGSTKSANDICVIKYVRCVSPCRFCKHTILIASHVSFLVHREEKDVAARFLLVFESRMRVSQ